MSVRQAVILAGGKGTRLHERLGDLPKPLIDLCGIPLLERQIQLLKRYGYEHVLILVSYKAEKIIEFCESHDNWGLQISCIDDGKPRGTAGAVLQVFDQLQDEFLVVYGDTMLEVDLSRFQTVHQQDPTSAATLFLHPNDHPHDSDLVELDDSGVVTGFYPYPHAEDRYLPNLVNAALYLVRKSALKTWQAHSHEMFDFGKQLFPMMIAHGLTLRGYDSPEYIKDCGTPQRIDKVSADFLSGKISRSALSHPQAAVFLDRDGTINCEVDHINQVDTFELLPGVEQAIRRLNLSEYRTCVVTNQPVIARGECTPDGLHNIHNKLETLLGRQGAFVDRIYFCPHHPDKGFAGEVPELKIDCNCRKPGTGMIEQAVTELNIQPKRSWMIGDTTTDLETARLAGLRSILVETGYAGLDHKYTVAPDYTVPDLAAAVNFILDVYPRALAEAREWTTGIEPGNAVFLGGQARSGKSSTASLFKEALAERGIHAHVVSTDRWLHSEVQRKPGVMGRHDMAALQSFAEMIADTVNRPEWVNLPAYAKKMREHLPDAERLNLHPRDVVIVEGVVALVLKTDCASHKFVVELDEQQRRERMLHEYRLRTGSMEEARAIYENRLADEIPIVQQTFGTATRIPSFVARRKASPIISTP